MKNYESLEDMTNSTFGLVIYPDLVIGTTWLEKRGLPKIFINQIIFGLPDEFALEASYDIYDLLSILPDNAEYFGDEEILSYLDEKDKLTVYVVQESINNKVLVIC